MTPSLLHDAFAHHIWATERLIDACAAVPSDQLETPVPGTHGSILSTFRHLVGTDCWYLSFFREPAAPIAWKAEPSLAVLRSTITRNGAAWTQLLAGEIDPDADVVEHGDGWNFHAAVGLRLAQVIQHGSDHRSQICTALTSFGLAPPELDLWAFGAATDRTRSEYLTQSIE